MDRSNFCERFQANLMVELAVKGWSRKTLSDRAGVSQTTLSRYLSDDPGQRRSPRIDVVANLCWALGCNYEDLLGPPEEMY